MCEELHDPFEDQVECARYKAERDALAQRMEEVASEIDRTLLGVEGIEDAPAMRWARGLREALGSLHSPRASHEDIEAARWVRDHGGLDSVKKLLDWVVGHCSTRQQLDFDFWLSGRVMHELGFEEDMADRDEVERRLLARLMPEGYEWPRFESGEPLRYEDHYVYDGREREVWHVDFDSCGKPTILNKDGTRFHPDKGERVERPEPKADTLTHERPDSWERLEEDAKKDTCAYFGVDGGGYGCSECPVKQWKESCDEVKSSDLVRRCRALAERSE